MMNDAVIALGSNINPEENTALAIEKIAERFHLQKKSEFIYTEPLGYTDQPDFLNGSVLIRSSAGKEDITTALKEIEQEMGRQRSGHKDGPRKIDLDLVFYSDQIIDADVHERDFLQQSVRELLPDSL